MSELRTIARDGEPVMQLKCPGCGQWGDIDDDQLHGRVSVDHTDTGCTYHETHDYAGEQEEAGTCAGGTDNSSLNRGDAR